MRAIRHRVRVEAHMEEYRARSPAYRLLRELKLPSAASFLLDVILAGVRNPAYSDDRCFLEPRIAPIHPHQSLT
jgi:hypothetical protein